MVIDIQDPIAIAVHLWRRKIWILLTALLGLAGAVVVVSLVEPIYEASTTVLIEPQKVPSSYVKTTITSQLQDRLKTLEEQIKRRDTMERLILETDLYQEMFAAVPMENLVALARENLEISVQRGRIVRISFSGPDAATAARAANGVADLMIEENLKLRAKQAESTTAFLEEELERTNSMLEEQESIVSQYRLRNANSLPDQRQANLVAISQLERRLELNRAEIEEIEIKKILLSQEPTARLEQMRAPKSVRDTRLELLELQLQELKSQYTDKHPDVIRLQAEIDSLSRTVRSREETRDSVTVPEPADLAQLEMERLDRDLEELKQEDLRTLDRISIYQRYLERTPHVEQELIGLSRDYKNLQNSYQSLLSKQIEARLAEELERKQQSEQFRILEEAVPPSSPFYPNRTLFLAFGVLVGASMGVGVVLALEVLDDTFPDAESLARTFPGVPAVIAIPRLSRVSAQHDELETGEKRTA